MIARFFLILLLLYALGFALFAVTLSGPADTKVHTDAAVVITGGSGRIERGFEVLGDGGAERLLIAGADPLVTKKDLVEEFGGTRKLVRCCVDLGSESVDTRSNAEEAKRWLDRHHYESVRLITSDWHMLRAGYEFDNVLGDDRTIVIDAVRTEPRLSTLFGEYNKYLLRRIAVWLDV